LHVVADPQRVNRTRELINMQAEEAWLLMLQEHDGTCSILQGDQQSTLAPGDIGFLDTSRPYEVLFPKTFRQSILKVPASLFKDIIPLRRDVAGMALAGSYPLTAIARINILMLERLAHTISPNLLPAAAERAIDHLSLAMRARLDDSPIRRDRGASARHFARASLYIGDHLRDSTLSVERVANATGISPGHLHEVFRRVTGGTIGDYIRTQRLDRCRRDLADQSLRH
jgi:AraC-like DNA-binding protein